MRVDQYLQQLQPRQEVAPLATTSIPHLFIYLLNFNYRDLNTQIINKLTIKIQLKITKITRSEL